MTHQLRAMDGTGDTKLIWTPGNEAEVTAAKAMFDSLVGKGYKAFGVKSNGEKSEPIAKFDASIEKIILVPQMKGG